jgi:hypothetical protein
MSDFTNILSKYPNFTMCDFHQEKEKEEYKNKNYITFNNNGNAISLFGDDLPAFNIPRFIIFKKDNHFRYAWASATDFYNDYIIYVTIEPTLFMNMEDMYSNVDFQIALKYFYL